MTLGNFCLSEPLEFSDGTINTLIIENPVFYRDFVSDIIEQANTKCGDFFLSENNKQMDFAKSVCIITDIFGIDFQTRQITAQILKNVGEECDEADTAQLITKLNMFAASLSARSSLCVTFKELTNAADFLKLFNFAIDTEEMNFCEKLTEYITLMSECFAKKLFVILNMKSALSDEEHTEFCKLAAYKKFNVLLIENKQCGICADNEKIRIIDNDLCELS